tara:strand:+ start:484 stop:1068 length:585 start_codon:yes stop_codon:yes gene_type:complete
MSNLSENQLNVLKAINENGKTYTGDFDVCFKFGLKTRSFKNTINSLVKRGLLIETKERFKSFSDTDGKFFNNSFVSVEISEAGIQAIQAEDQAEDVQAEAKPKALKESTVKRYDVHQLTRHLEKLQDHFLIAPFRIDTIIREYDSYTNSYLVYCQIHEKNRDFILDAIESIYRKLKIDWSWPNLQHGNYEEITC